MQTGEDLAPTEEVLPAEPGAGSEDHKETQAGVRGKVCPESPGQEAASPAHTQTRPPGSARKRAREGGSIPTERGPPEVGPGPGHSPGLRTGPSAWCGCRGAQSGAWVRVSQCGGGCGQQWACPGPQALPEPGVLPSAAPLSPGTRRWAWEQESDVTLDRPEDSNASGPPPRAGGDGLRWRGPLRAGPCPSSETWSYPSRHVQTEDSRANQRGRGWIGDRPELPTLLARTLEPREHELLCDGSARRWLPRLEPACLARRLAWGRKGPLSSAGRRLLRRDGVTAGAGPGADGGRGLGARGTETTPDGALPLHAQIPLPLARGARPAPGAPGGGCLPIYGGRGPDLHPTPPWDPDGPRGTEGNRGSPLGRLGKSRQCSALLLGFWCLAQG